MPYVLAQRPACRQARRPKIYDGKVDLDNLDKKCSSKSRMIITTASVSAVWYTVSPLEEQSELSFGIPMTGREERYILGDISSSRRILSSISSTLLKK